MGTGSRRRCICGTLAPLRRQPRDFRPSVALCVCGARDDQGLRPHVSTTQQRTVAPSAPTSPGEEPDVSVVIPCLNEEDNIERCGTDALEAMARSGINGEVVVADNDS